MKKFILILLCFSLAGCATGQVSALKESVSESEKEITDKDKEIERLKGLLKDKEIQLQEKDAKIKELREKLELFGVFEK